MRAILIKTEVPIGSRRVGSYMVVETKEVGVISVVDAEHGINLIISGYPDDWGGEVKKINVRTEETAKAKLPEELKGLKIIKLEEEDKQIEVPDELVMAALEVADRKARYKCAKERFKEEHQRTISTLIGRLHSSKGERPLGGNK